MTTPVSGKNVVAKNFKVKDQLLARFTVCVDTDTYNKLTERARRLNMHRSELVRGILVEYIAQQRKSPQPSVQHNVGTHGTQV